MTSLALRRRKLEFKIQEGWSALILLSLALIMVAWSINEAGYDESLADLTLVTIAAIGAALLLAKSRFPWFIAHLFSLLYGIAWNALLVTQRLPATFTPRERLLELGYRIGTWFGQAVLGGQQGTDPLMFAVVMSVLFWAMAYFAVWFSFRAHNLWAALLPSGVTFFLNLYYGPDRISFALVPYLLFVLLFVVRFNLYAQERGWKQRKVRYDSDIVYTFLRYGAILALLTIALAWVVPATASSEPAEVFFSRFGKPWDWVKEEWIRLFSTLQAGRVLPSYGVFGDTLELGGPVNLGNTTLMDVQASAGRYWRAAVYDEYTGRGWESNASDAIFMEAGDLPGEMIPYEARRVVTQTFTLYVPDATQLYALGQPERFSLPIRATLFEAASPEGERLVDSFSAVDSRYKLDEGESYMVVSSMSAIAEDTMRQAGKEYPAWIDRYLQLPDDLPQRVRDLAQEVTAAYQNPYDKAVALQDFLREYTYNELVQAPPEGVDRVDYFLFEMKEGYCNYYASAMVVMARSVGVPARIAAGYAQGDWERDEAVYRVREHHSHAWVEVYLPRFGWIEFEPTASEPGIVRPRMITAPLGSGGSTDDSPMDNFLEDDLFAGNNMFDQAEFDALMREQLRRERLRTWTRVGGVLGVGAAVVLFAWWQGRKKMDEIRPARAYYDRMVRHGTWGGCDMRLSHTPNEYATQLAACLAEPDGEKLVYRITDAYVGENYGKKNPARHQPDFAWRDLRPLLTRWGLKQRWLRLWTRR